MYRIWSHSADCYIGYGWGIEKFYNRKNISLVISGTRIQVSAISIDILFLLLVKAIAHKSHTEPTIDMTTLGKLMLTPYVYKGSR